MDIMLFHDNPVVACDACHQGVLAEGTFVIASEPQSPQHFPVFRAACSDVCRVALEHNLVSPTRWMGWEHFLKMIGGQHAAR